MAYDGIFTHAIINELNKQILGMRVSKIGMPGKSEIALTFRSEKKLLINIESASPYITLTDTVGLNPDSPPGFLILLRKHLGKGILTEISQYLLDRVIIFKFDSTDEMGFPRKYNLIVELMGKHSNIILTNEEMKVVDSIKKVTPDMSAKRVIMPGVQYEFFDNDKDDIMVDGFEKIFKLPADQRAKFLYKNYNGFSPALANFLFALNMDSKQLFEYFKRMLTSGKYYLFYDDEGKTKDFHIFNMSENSKEYDSIFDVVNLFYSMRVRISSSKGKVSNLKKVLDSKISRLQNKIGVLMDEYQQNSNCDIYKEYGDILMANLYNLKDVPEKAQLFNYYSGENVVIDLDNQISAAANANKYYKLYGKQKTSLEHIEKQLKLAKEDIEYLSTVVTALENNLSAEDVEEIQRELYEQKFIKSKPKYGKKTKIDILKIKIGEFSVLVGKNNIQNDQITFKLSSKDDIWFHVKDMPGSHVLLKGEGVADEDVTAKCAKLAAYFSKARNSSSVPVDYTYAKYVKKPSGAKPGYVIYKEQNTIYVTPDEETIYQLLKKNGSK